MAKDILKSLVIGLVVTVGLLALSIIGTHTILEAILLPFTAPLTLLASVVSYENHESPSRCYVGDDQFVRIHDSFR